MNKSTLVIAAIAGAAMSTSAMGAITITQGPAQQAFIDYEINFDEPGVPTGVTLPTNFYQGSHGATITPGQAGTGGVYDWSTYLGFPTGTGLSYLGPNGVTFVFDYAVTGLDLQMLDPAGPGGPFGGGARIDLFDNGSTVGSLFFGPAWGGTGDEWLHVIADGGDSFDSFTVQGFGNPPTTYIDNVTWTPAPGSLALLGFAGMAMRRRRA